MTKHDHVDFLINVALGFVLIVGGCVGIVAVIAAINGVTSLVGISYDDRSAGTAIT